MRALVDRNTKALDGRSQPAHQPGGVDPGAVRVVEPPSAPATSIRLGGLGGVEQARSGLGPRGLGVRRGPQPAQLGRGAGDVELAALGDVGVDALGGGQPR